MIDLNGAEIAHSVALIASCERPRWDGLSWNLADLTHYRGHGLPHFVALLGYFSANNPAAAQQLALDCLFGVGAINLLRIGIARDGPRFS
jgi:hypothetical protein